MLPIITFQMIVLGLAVLTQLTSGCTISNHFCKSNKDNFGIVCNDVFGYNYEEKEQVAKNTEDILDLYKKQMKLEDELWLAFNQAEHIQNVLNMMQGDSDSLQDTLELLQTQTNNNLLQIATLQLQMSGIQNEVRVVGLFDPCGDAPNVLDEVGIKLSNGHIIFYFEQGNNRRLSELGPGSYVTTDGSNCHFTIN